MIGEAKAAGSVRLFSVRHDFPDAWARFTGMANSETDRFRLSIPLRPQLYPFWSVGSLGSVKALEVLAQPSPGAAADKHDRAFEQVKKTSAVIAATLTKRPELGNLLRGAFDPANFPAAPDSGSLEWFFDGKQFDDLWIAITWGA